jgi:hypothetical protein
MMKVAQARTTKNPTEKINSEFQIGLKAKSFAKPWNASSG